MLDSLRVVFMGSGDFAAPTLAKIISAEHLELLAIYTARAARPGSNPVYDESERFGVTIMTPLRIDAEVIGVLRDLAPDLVVVVSYGLILPAALLAIPRFGCLNLHPSALPRWRGAAPIQRALLAGDDALEVCVMLMDQGCDTGPVLRRQQDEIGSNETHGEISKRAARIGAAMMLGVIDQVVRHGCMPPAAQQDDVGAVYAHKIKREDERLDWNRSSTELHNQIRGLSPVPGAYCFWGERRVKILRSRCLDRREIVELGMVCGEMEKVGERPELAEGEDAGAAARSVCDQLRYRYSAGGVGQDDKGWRRWHPGDIQVSGRRLFVACGGGNGGDGDWLEVLELQVEGGKRVDAPAFINGNLNRK